VTLIRPVRVSSARWSSVAVNLVVELSRVRAFLAHSERFRLGRTCSNLSVTSLEPAIWRRDHEWHVKTSTDCQNPSLFRSPAAATPPTGAFQPVWGRFRPNPSSFPTVAANPFICRLCHKKVSKPVPKSKCRKTLKCAPDGRANRGQIGRPRLACTTA
jgi:hypothetical protein